MKLQPIGARLIILSVLRKKLVRAKTANYELHHGQLPLLERIIDNPGSTQQEIASWLMVSSASVAQSLTRLARDGLIERTVDPDNRRQNRVYATEAGKRAAALYRKSFDEVDQKTFANLTDGELEQFASLLDRMIENLDDAEMGVRPCFDWKEKLPE